MFADIRELSAGLSMLADHHDIYVSPSGTTLVVGPHAILRDGDCRTSSALEWINAGKQSKGSTCLDGNHYEVETLIHVDSFESAERVDE